MEDTNHSLCRKMVYSFLTPRFGVWGLCLCLTASAYGKPWRDRLHCRSTLRCYTVAAFSNPRAPGSKTESAAPQQSQEGNETLHRPETNREGASWHPTSQCAPHAARVPQVPLEAAARGESRARSRRTPVPPDGSSLPHPAPGTRQARRAGSAPRLPARTRFSAPVPSSPGRAGTAESRKPRSPKQRRRPAGHKGWPGSLRRRSPGQARAPGFGLSGRRCRLSPAFPPRRSEATG